MSVFSFGPNKTRLVSESVLLFLVQMDTSAESYKAILTL